MTNRKLALIGGGQMGRALVGGMIARGGLVEGDVQVVDPDPVCRRWWQDGYPQAAVGSDPASAVANADAVLLAVKPNIVSAVLQQAAGRWEGKLVVSIAAGIALDSLCRQLGHRRVARVMPNTPCLVGQGASGYCVADQVDASDQQWIESMLGSVGLVVGVAEGQMDAVTGLSGSGPAYVCLVIEALADGGVRAGLPRPLAMQLATQTVLGTAAMVRDTGRHPAELKDAVASPGGTTIAAIAVLEQNGLRSALIEAVTASAVRSQQLGRPKA